jgi:hypothetical protein
MALVCHHRIMTRRSLDERLQKAADCLSRLGVLDRTLCRCRLDGTILKLQPNSLFEDGIGPGSGPVGGEFQPRLEIVHPGGGAHLFSVRQSISVLMRRLLR